MTKDTDRFAKSGRIETCLGVNPAPNNQRFVEFVRVLDVPGEVEVEPFSVGLHNSFDLVFTTRGIVFATGLPLAEPTLAISTIRLF